MKRFVFVLVVLALSVPLLFAGGDGDEAADSGAAMGATPISIIVPGDRPKDMDMVIEALEKAFGEDVAPIDLSMEFIGFDDFRTKLALKVAAAEPMDLIFDPAWLNFYQMQSQGAFIPLNDIIPNLSFYGTPGNVPGAVWGAVSVGSDIYGLPAIENNYVRRADRGQLAVRADLVAKYAPNGISTGAEMLDFLIAVNENEPQYLALNAEREGTLPISPAGLYGKDGVAQATWGELNTALGLYADPNASGVPTVFSSFFTEEFELDVEGATKLQDLGLVSFEEVPDKRAAFVAGRMATIGADKDDYAMMIHPQVKDTFGVEWVILDPKPRGVLQRATGNWFCISAASEAPVLAAEFINWIMSSQANYELWAYGIEGTHFNVVDGVIQKINPEARNYEMLWWYVFNRAHLRQDLSATPDAEAFLNWANVDANSVANPTIGFPWNQEPIKTEIAQVSAVIAEFNGLNLGLNPVSDIPVFREQLNAAGLQTILDETNRQLAQWYAAK